MNRRVILTTILVSVLAFGVTGAAAHELWWEAERDGYTLHYGHMPTAHPGHHEVPYEAKDVARVFCLRGDGVLLTYLELNESPVHVSGDYIAIQAELTPEVWTKTTHGVVNRPKTEVERPLASWESCGNVKQIMAWHPDLSSPFGEGLEIAPADDPTELCRGAKLRLIAFLDGLAMEGVTVAYNGEEQGVTAADGRIEVRLSDAGTQYIQASLERTLDAPRADKVMHTAALAFDLKETPSDGGETP